MHVPNALEGIGITGLSKHVCLYSHLSALLLDYLQQFLLDLVKRGVETENKQGRAKREQ